MMNLVYFQPSNAIVCRTNDELGGDHWEGEIVDQTWFLGKPRAALISIYQDTAKGIGKTKVRKSFDSKKLIIEEIRSICDKAELEIIDTVTDDPKQPQVAPDAPPMGTKKETVDQPPLGDHRASMKRNKGISIRKLANDFIMDGFSTEEILNKIYARVSTTRATASDISIYRRKLRAAGKSVPPVFATKVARLRKNEKK